MRDKPVQVGSELHWPFIAAWVCCVIFYFLQYALRSAPGVMIPELTKVTARHGSGKFCAKRLSVNLPMQ